MPTRIEDEPEDDKSWYSKREKPCPDPDHNPPMAIVIPAGKVLVHTCPRCGKEVRIHGRPTYYHTL